MERTLVLSVLHNVRCALTSSCRYNGANYSPRPTTCYIERSVVRYAVADMQVMNYVLRS